MKNLLKILATLIVYILATLYSGLTISLLWKWFVVPVFELPLLTIPYAIGIGCLVHFVTIPLRLKDLETNDKSWTDNFCSAIGIMIGKPTGALLLGWIVTQFL